MQESEKKLKLKNKKSKNENEKKGCKGVKRNNILLFFVGGIIGILNGFFGGGGGTVGVPVLERFLGLDNKKAHATCIAIIFPLSVVSAGIYVFGGAVETSLFLFVGLGVILGGVIGSFLLKILPSKAVRIIFAVLLLAGGVRMILW